jgi:hypothetical protein
MPDAPAENAATAVHVALARYQIGDTVWWLHTWDVPDRKPCPVCKGERRVRIEGMDRWVPCPESSTGADPRVRCSDGTIRGDGTATRCYLDPRTIGQVRVTVTEGEPVEVVYMAHETGIGSGSLLPEEKLFPTYEAAVEAAGQAERVPYDRA